MNIGDTIYEESDGMQKVPVNPEIINLEGVWALYGKSEVDSDFICLNVGKSINISSEILYNLGCYHFLKFRTDGDENYLNQFEENCGFKYKSGQTQEYLYPYIALKYPDIKVVYVHNKSDLNAERKYAEENHALFWRNGSAFGVKKKLNWNRADIQTLCNYFKNGGETYTEDELLMKLVADLGIEIKNAKTVITLCKNNGLIYEVDTGIYTR